MTTIQAKRIKDALAKAKSVGRVERSFTVDGCPIALQSLRPSDYQDIMVECEDKPDLEYLFAYQQGHICRSVVEIGEIDFRDVQFVEDEVPAAHFVVEASVPTEELAEQLKKAVEEAGGKATITPPDPNGETRTIKVEAHEWIRDSVVNSWSREALGVVWKKFTEVQEDAEEKAREGVEFRIPDETDEEKYRRLLAEIKDIEQELPPTLVTRVLTEHGYFLGSSQQELASATSKIDQLDMDRFQKEPEPTQAASPPQAPQPPTPPAQAPQAPPQAAPQPVQTPVAQQPVQGQTQTPLPADPQAMMAARQPLNRQAIQNPVPQAPQQNSQRVRRPQVPEQLREAAMANSASMTRAERIAAMEAEAEKSFAQAAPDQSAPQQPTDVHVIERPSAQVDPDAAKTILDQPPPVGINPRFKPPQM